MKKLIIAALLGIVSVGCKQSIDVGYIGDNLSFKSTIEKPQIKSILVVDSGGRIMVYANLQLIYSTRPVSDTLIAESFDASKLKK